MYFGENKHFLIPDMQSSRPNSKDGCNATALKCDGALVFKECLPLTIKQVGGVRYIEDKDGKRYQVKEIITWASEQHNVMIIALGRVSGRLGTIEMLRDSGCSTIVIRGDLFDRVTSRARQEVA